MKSLFLITLFLFSCSTTENIQKQEEVAEIDPGLDPSGYWKVESKPIGCSITSKYGQGEPQIVQSDFFDCSILPAKDLIPTRSFIVAYNKKVNTLDIETDGLIRRMKLATEESQFPGGYATEPLYELGPSAIRAGCNASVRAFNVIIFEDDSNASKALYGANMMTFYFPQEGAPNGCRNYLRDVGDAIMNGTASTLFMQYHQLGGIDANRLADLENIGLLFQYPAVKTYD